jgi:hypothetical protein
MAEPLRLLEQMRRSKASWRLADLHRLYIGFGFEWEEGARHRLYKHPRYPELYATVTRSSGPLPIGYVANAVSLIDAVRKREDQNGDRREQPRG